MLKLTLTWRAKNWWSVISTLLGKLHITYRTYLKHGQIVQIGYMAMKKDDIFTWPWCWFFFFVVLLISYFFLLCNLYLNKIAGVCIWEWTCLSKTSRLALIREFRHRELYTWGLAKSGELNKFKFCERGMWKYPPGALEWFNQTSMSDKQVNGEERIVEARRERTSVVWPQLGNMVISRRLLGNIGETQKRNHSTRRLVGPRWKYYRSHSIYTLHLGILC